MMLFRGVASFYARFRAGYPRGLFDHLIAAFALDATTLVVDAGTGTGQLAIPLAARGVPVLAFDPEPEMLAEARSRAVAARPPGRLAFVEGRAEDLLELAPPPVRLLTFGASFHWTDRDRVLALCDQLVEPRGGVAVISGGPAITPTWSRVVDEVVATFLGPRRRAGDGFYEHPRERHEQVLGRSAFSHVERFTTRVELYRTADEVVGLTRSTSGCTPALLGERQAEFDATLRARLLELEPADRFVEDHEVEALCCRR